MGRRGRILEAGIYHLAVHGSDTRRLFLSDEDREDFLKRIGAACERFEIEFVSYVLMGNHYHGLVQIADRRFSEALRNLHTEYSRSHNRQHGRSAHLFRAHPHVGAIESGEQLITVSRYLARNPVRAGLVGNPFEWPWSSAAAHAGLVKPHIRLLENDLADAFGEGHDWRDRYREYILAEDEERPA